MLHPGGSESLTVIPKTSPGCPVSIVHLHILTSLLVRLNRKPTPQGSNDQIALNRSAAQRATGPPCFWDCAGDPTRIPSGVGRDVRYNPTARIAHRAHELCHPNLTRRLRRATPNQRLLAIGAAGSSCQGRDRCWWQGRKSVPASTSLRAYPNRSMKSGLRTNATATEGRSRNHDGHAGRFHCRYERRPAGKSVTRTFVPCKPMCVSARDRA
jgi:hypothetical protein